MSRSPLGGFELIFKHVRWSQLNYNYKIKPTQPDSLRFDES